MEWVQLDLEAFRRTIQNREVICIGAGIQGKRFACLIENWNLQGSIIAFADNNKALQGNDFQYRTMRYPILSIDKAVRMADKNALWVIACLDENAIKEQLQQYAEMKDALVTSLSAVAMAQLRISDYEAVIREYQEPVIPKVIHYVWVGGRMPETYQRNIENWKQKCPDYEIVEWNESNYDFKKNSYTYEAYVSKRYGFVPDFSRLDILYQYGGIYLDVDVEICQQLDDLVFQKGFAFMDSTLLVNHGSGIGCVKGLDIIGEFRDAYADQKFRYQGGSYNLDPCMLYTYEVLSRYGWQIKDQIQTIKGLNIYPMICVGNSAYTRETHITEKTYVTHWGARSWLKRNTV